MSRVKENQEAINVLYEQITNTDAESTEEVVCIHIGVLAAILTDISKSLAVIADKAESEKEWIPANGKMPDDGQRVLITREGLINFVQEAMYHDNAARKGFMRPDSKMIDNELVKAWMPLPKPYKAESEDKND